MQALIIPTGLLGTAVFLFFGIALFPNIVGFGKIAFGIYFFLGGVWWGFKPYRYNNDVLIVPNWYPMTRKLNWSELREVDPNQKGWTHNLWFTRTRKVQIPIFFGGAQDLVNFAKAKLDARVT